MSIVRLGKIHLHWCRKCNVPIVEKGVCGSCGEEARKVEVTPPGDVRPAFEKDIEHIKETIDGQWGVGYSEEIISKDKTVVLNSTPYLDKMDEVIVDGEVLGTFRYNPNKRAEGKDPYEFLLRPWEGLPSPKKGFVVIDKGAVEPILSGGSVLNPGIIDADPDIRKGDEVIVFGPDEEIICSGSAMISGKEMINSSSGIGVKNRWRRSDHTPKEKEADWTDAVKANKPLIEKRVEKAISFIEEQLQKHEKPAAVAYSGGKDSLATLHLLLEAGKKPDLIFVDTGIELPETVENVEHVAEKYDLRLLMKKAKSGYWDNVEYFGPSARDYRWCCKTCKLGPTALLIKEHYEKGVLSFIGQRKYESSQRKSQGSTWNNPWVPGQDAASPIQDWTALHVWLYLFKKDADWNPWYEKGFERIGCWVCPASDIAALDRLKKEYDDFEKFEKVLERYADKKGLSQKWIELGLWRWLDPPKHIEEIYEDVEKAEKASKEDSIESRSIEDFIQHERTRNLLNALYDVEGECVEEESENEELIRIHKKALHCVECGVCVGRCEKEAIYFENGIKIDPERCIHCGRCLGECPVVRYDSRT